ncbi:MAG: hypothetical protein KDC25_03135 [Saprospiraceae bacterium]|nr:hypothetical protein [Saprospiraceae bacterium]
MWLGITDIKKEIKAYLSPYFKDIGFQFKTGFNGVNIGFKQKNIDFFYISVGVYNTGNIILIPMSGYLDSVEKTLFKIRLPSKSVQYYYEKPYKALSHITIIENNNFQDRIKSVTLYSKEDIHRFCDKIIEYMDTRGLVFIEQNNSIEKIYQQIINNWLKGSVEPIVQDTSKYFKALIILRLMKDPNIEDYKSQFSEKLLAYRNPEAWLQSYKNLYELLDSPDFEKEYLI